MIREIERVEIHRITDETSNEYVTVKMEYRGKKLSCWSILPFDGTAGNTFKFKNGCIVQTGCIVNLLEKAVRFVDDTKARLSSEGS